MRLIQQQLRSSALKEAEDKQRLPNFLGALLSAPLQKLNLPF
jgi:hypothetical protein